MKTKFFTIFYRIKVKSIKFYKRLLYHFTDLCIVNGFILWKVMKEQPGLPLFEYKLQVAISLMYADNFGEPMSRAAIGLRASQVLTAANGDPVGGAGLGDDARLDGRNHWPEVAAKIPRACKLKGCKLRTVMWCTKCKVYLCVKSNNCFVQYHTIV